MTAPSTDETTRPRYIPLPGPECRACGATEQDHARDGGCCNACTHWDNLDENGNEFTRYEHGTERGYQQHRWSGIPFCDECRLAHRMHNRAIDARKRMVTV